MAGEGQSICVLLITVQGERPTPTPLYVQLLLHNKYTTDTIMLLCLYVRNQSNTHIVEIYSYLSSLMLSVQY